MTGLSERHVRRHGSELGGWRSATRGRPWRFDQGLVQAYLDTTGRHVG